MSIISVLLVLIAVGVVLYIINSMIPMDGKVKQIINAVILIVLVLWLLNLFVPLGLHFR